MARDNTKLDFTDYKRWYVETQLDTDEYYAQMTSIFAREFEVQMDVAIFQEYVQYLEKPATLDTKEERDALEAAKIMRDLMKRLRNER